MTALSKQLTTMTEEKKSYVKRFKKGIQALFNKEGKKSIENETREKPKTQIKPPIKVTPVSELLEKFDEQKRENDTKNNESTTTSDELKNFSVKTVKFDGEKSVNTVKNDARNVSVSSNDSGYAEDVTVKLENDETGDLIQSLVNWDIDDKKKSKKPQTVYITRAPDRRKFEHSSLSHPYNQVNRTFLSGGTVILNDTFDSPQDDMQQIVEKLIVEKSFDDNDLHNLLLTTNEGNDEMSVEKSDFSNGNAEDILSGFGIDGTYLTPPRSIENVFSPPSLSPNASFYPSPPHRNMCSPNPLRLTSYVSQEGFGEELNNVEVSPNSNYSLSSESFLKTDDEEPLSFDTFEESQIPSSVFHTAAEDIKDDGVETPRPRERSKSSSTAVTMKQYKDMQSELSAEFAKHDCCADIPKDSSREFLRGHFLKLDADQRKNLCLQVARLDLRTTVLGVLNNIILTLSSAVASDATTEQQVLLYALFGLLCERVMAEEPELFLQEFGLHLLESCTLRCPALPVLTRHAARCVRLAAQRALGPAGEPIFKETDARGDNLLGACARRGDTCSDVLAELVRRDTDDVTRPLFDVKHVNAEGHSALHVACLSHARGARSCLHAVHVLLAHGHADLYQGDIKGGDTALHLAVNSVSCDLQLVMTMFKHVDRKLWKRLAHTPNRSSVTPLEYARSATKASTRQNYPQEVLNFLKKCR